MVFDKESQALRGVPYDREIRIHMDYNGFKGFDII
jgi:hypothetical protein